MCSGLFAVILGPMEQEPGRGTITFEDPELTEEEELWELQMFVTLSTFLPCTSRFFLYFSGHITELPPCSFRLHVSKVSPKSFEPFGEKQRILSYMQ